jgi:hypothetical protein
MASKKTESQDILSMLGFSTQRGSHNARTIMLDELRTLLSHVDNPASSQKAYLEAIKEDNCLSKRSGKTRELTARHLVALYGLNSELTLFRMLLYLWNRDSAAQPVLSLLCSYARDSILRMSASYILATPEGGLVTTANMVEHLERKMPGSYSESTLKSTAQNLNSSWTKAGYLAGRAKKVRVKLHPTPGAAAFALFLGYLKGVRGESLFETEYARLMDCSMEQIIELAEAAGRKGWIIFKKVGNVIEVLFPNNITREEMELLREQS